MKVKNLFLILVLSLTGLTGLSFMDETSIRNETAETLEQGFLTPPNAAKPRTWWHWMNGNITKEGIRADLEWMNRAGLGGFQTFDAGLDVPQIVDKRLVYMTPDWKDAFFLATTMADSLGLEMAIAASPGWSESGGPWVRPHEAMKKYVWTETQIEGGKPYSGLLPKPSTVTGLFQNLLRTDRRNPPIPYNEYYADAAVIAWRLPDSDISLQELNPVVRSSGGRFTLAELTDGDLRKSSLLPFAEEGKSSWIQFEFPSPVTMQALSIVESSRGTLSSERFLEAGNDGKAFYKVISISPGGAAQKTHSFQPTTAKYFRFCWNRLPAPSTPAAGQPGVIQATPSGYNVAELVLHTGGRVNRFEEKAGFAMAIDLYNAFTPAVQSADVVKKSEVMDITDKMNADGTLNWTPPAGRWKVMRLGYSLTGQFNSPASAEATGLEVDKLSAEHVSSYFTQYLDRYKDATQGLMGRRGLQYVITDSWEAGIHNWTDRMMAEFEKYRGYSMIPWLPVLSGHIVESAEASDKFLWDFRKTLADLVVEKHYDQLSILLKERGMGRYSESHEGGRAFIADGMEVEGKADVSMAAFWTPGDNGQNQNESDILSRHQLDIREAASSAHIYGNNLVAAESFTAPRQGPYWTWSPATLKPIADYAFSCGLNRIVYHTTIHQPVFDKLPGQGLGQFGQWLGRNETWAEQAIAWTTYLSRTCYMLQQGKYVADIAYYYGEDNDISSLFRTKFPEIPQEYSYDFVNADALVHLMTVENGQIVTPSGMRYRVLGLDKNSRYMTLKVLRKIRDMVEKGAIVYGTKPVQSPSLADNPEEFDAIVRQLWAKNGANKIGKGVVYVGASLPDVLKLQKIAPDFSYKKTKADTELFFVHRKMDDIEIYWVANHIDRVEDVEVSFRVSTMEPELWHPVTGVMEKVSYSIAGGVTKIPLHLEPYDAVFVVFKNKTNNKSFTQPKTTQTQLATVTGEWNVAFQAGRGAPASAVFASLTPWNENNDRGIKYFSGTATYSKTVQAPAEWFIPEAQLWLDLGDVQNIAEVTVNGKPAGIAWTKPYRVNVTGALKQGDNQLEIKVSNLWVNRLIGDRQPNAEKFTWTNFEPYEADSPLKPSGLLGPVRIQKLIR